MFRPSRPRAVTLAEILLAMGLGAVVLSAVVVFFISASRLGRNFLDQTTTQQQCQVVQHFFQERIYRALPDSLYCPADGSFCSWLSNDDADGGPHYDAANQILWQGRSVAYLGGDTLRWQRLALTPPTPVPAPLQLLSFTPGSQDRAVGRGIAVFQARKRGPAVFFRVVARQGKASTEILAVSRPLLPEEP